jgi:hypothetical protein
MVFNPEEDLHDVVESLGITRRVKYRGTLHLSLH